jgi:GNAT superfamily N-acetyltransferase
MSAPVPFPDPATVSDDAIAIGLCGPEHRAEQARLFDACFKKGATPGDLAWRYDQGPHGEAVSLLARPPGGEGISGYACSPRLALVRGDDATLAPVGETGDVMTHPAWRKRGIFSGLDRRAMEETARRGWPLAFGLPNRRSAHIFLELGWERIGAVRPYSFPLRPTAGARAEVLKDGRARAWLLRWHALRRRRALARVLPRVRRFRAEHALTAFPPETLTLSREVERRFAFMVRRDPEYLTWRFLRNPSRLHEATALYAGDDLAAVGVVQRPREPGGTGYLVDVLAPEPDALEAALFRAILRLDEFGAGVVQATALDGSWWRGTLLDAGFLAPKPENHLIVILHPNDETHPLVAAARDTAGWYFTDGDRDDATMG